MILANDLPAIGLARKGRIVTVRLHALSAL